MKVTDPLIHSFNHSLIRERAQSPLFRQGSAVPAGIQKEVELDGEGSARC
jgi:hypothetical protein